MIIKEVVKLRLLWTKFNLFQLNNQYIKIIVKEKNNSMPHLKFEKRNLNNFLLVKSYKKKESQILSLIQFYSGVTINTLLFFLMIFS